MVYINFIREIRVIRTNIICGYVFCIVSIIGTLFNELPTNCFPNHNRHEEGLAWHMLSPFLR